MLQCLPYLLPASFFGVVVLDARDEITLVQEQISAAGRFDDAFRWGGVTRKHNGLTVIIEAICQILNRVAPRAAVTLRPPSSKTTPAPTS